MIFAFYVLFKIDHEYGFAVYMGAAIINFFVWGPWFKVMPELALVMWVLAIILAIVSLADILAGKSQGWSQFKAMWRKKEL